jgi:GNAT superfamily N-acetyltransferase
MPPERPSHPATLRLPARLRRPPRRPLVIRELQPGDETRVQEFFYSHTPDTIYERYGCLVSTMTAERAAALVNVDRTRDRALGIFTGPEGRLDAIGRYCRDRNGAGAELAFVVREIMRCCGMATALLHHLMRMARAGRLTRLWAQVNSSNAAMLGIFRRQGFSLKAEPDNGIIQATLTLASPHVRARRNRKIREALGKERRVSGLRSTPTVARLRPIA